MNLRQLKIRPGLYSTLTSVLLLGCGPADPPDNGGLGGASARGGGSSGGALNTSQGGLGNGGTGNGGSLTGGSTSNGGGGSNAFGGAGGGTSGGAANGGASLGGTTASGGAPASGGRAMGGNAAGGATAGGNSSGGAASGGRNSGGSSSGGSGGAGNSAYPCNGTTTGYNAVMTKSGSTWTVTNGSRQVYSGDSMQAALVAAYGSLTASRTTKESILVQGSGDIPASAQVSIPSYTILNVCGTLNVSGSPSGSDRSPLYARNARQIEIPNLKMTGSPQYGIFMRTTNDIHLGHIELRLNSNAGIGIRIDSSGNAGSDTNFSQNLTIDYVYGTGMGSHIVETYGVSNIKIGTVEGEDVGECGLLLNRSINAEVGLVSCTDCGTGTGYARGGGRGIFSVSGSGGLTIDHVDIANTGNGPILFQNAYNTTIAAVSGTVVGGLVQISNDTANTESGRYAPSKNVSLRNLTLSGGASVRQDWCAQYGANGSTATNITGGTVSMCR